MSDKDKGWYRKYVIAKANGSPIDPEADYFVLRLDTDPAARAAAREYATNCGNHQLRVDLFGRCQQHGNLGEARVRDPENPCGSFVPGEPASNCATDGHYLCRECRYAPPGVVSPLPSNPRPTAGGQASPVSEGSDK